MRERPIIFSGPMASSIREDRKTKTRRVVTPQPPAGWGRHCWFDAPKYGWTDQPSPTRDWHVVRCPYGVPGDRLWVRENVQAVVDAGDISRLRYPADGQLADIENTAEGADRWLDLYHYDAKRRPKGSVVPSIHMPRWACRLVLELTDVRAERLQDIDDDDARDEGLEVFNFTGWGDEPGVPHVPEPDVYRGTNLLDWEESPVVAFRHLWDHINGARPGCTWADNPWVWVLGFKRVPA